MRHDPFSVTEAQADCESDDQVRIDGTGIDDPRLIRLSREYLRAIEAG